MEDGTQPEVSSVTEAQSCRAPLTEHQAVIRDAALRSPALVVGRYEALEALYTFIASAPLDLVQDAIIQIRGGASVEAVAARMVSLHDGIVGG